MEVEDPIPFDQDVQHTTYEPGHAHRCWQVLRQADRVLAEFRSGFVGKCSPVQFYWGSFDLAVTRFSGRRAPEHPGGIPNLADYVAQEAYSRECSSFGFWPGSGAVQEPAFYAYAYPEPAGYREYPIRPGEASYSEEMREYVLPYEAVRHARDPDQMLRDFLQTTYEAAAELGGWGTGRPSSMTIPVPTMPPHNRRQSFRDTTRRSDYGETEARRSRLSRLERWGAARGTRLALHPLLDPVQQETIS